jgi:hypothetical protein
MIKGTLGKFYLAVCGFVLITYLAVEARAVVFEGTDLPANVQGPPGSHHHGSAGHGWFVGYHGGK